MVVPSTLENLFGSYEPQSLHVFIDFNMLKITRHVQ